MYKGDADMKLTSKLFAALCLCLALCLAVPALLPVNLGIETAARAESKVKLNKSTVTLCLGETLQLKLKNAEGKVTWKSSAKDIAKVSKKGVVTAKKAGKAKITATLNGKRYSCFVIVKNGIVAIATKVSLKAGKKKDVKVTLEGYDEVAVAWDRADVVSCAFTGGWKGKTITLRIKALDKGTAKVKLTNKKTKDTVTIKVTVK